MHGQASAEDRAERYPKVNIFNHAWDRADALTTIGSISAPEVETLTGGLLCEPMDSSDDMQRKDRIQAANLTARASGGSDSSRSGREIQRLWSPTLPSISSRRMSTWPAWRAVSSSMWMSTQRSDTASPNHAVPVASRSSSSMTRSEAERARL
jgi:hypothetical protein